MIQTQLENLKNELPDGVKLVAVSKFHPSSKIRAAYAAGQRAFAESRAQELLQKVEELKDLTDVEWHFIGPLQSNKVRQIVPYVSLIQSASSEKLLAEINKQAERCAKTIDVLIELHIAEEAAKSGFSLNELPPLLERIYGEGLYPNVRVRGLMGMATLTDDDAKIRKEFLSLKTLFLEMKALYGTRDFDTLSMGMSGDYRLAVEEGSTMVRIGSYIFGEREY